MNWRKWILKIHLYGGLLCFWYLIIFAISSLHFQHEFSFMEPRANNETRTVIPFKVDLSGTDETVATHLQNQLELVGWYLPWETYRDKSNHFFTEIHNPKTNYKIEYNPLSEAVTITAKEKGLWSVVSGLHGFSEPMPGAPLLEVWGAYTYLTMVVVLFSIFSGLWLWLAKSMGRRDLMIFAGVVLLSFALLTIIYLNG